MAGHSKWANIKHRKEAVDGKKGALYAQLSKEISVAARLGGKDPNFNFRLRNAIDRARTLGTPNDNIQRAIDKFQNQGQQLEEIIYEGYGPEGIALLIQAATDNRNRTAAELRFILSRSDGNLGETGCVNWNFKHIGLIQSSNNQLKDEEIINLLTELNLEDCDFDVEENEISLITEVQNFEETLTKLKNKFKCHGELIYSGLNQIEIKNTETIEKFEKLLNKLEENEDVQRVFHNANMLS